MSVVQIFDNQTSINMSEWSERIYEAVGSGTFTPQMSSDETYFESEAPKVLNWSYSVKTLPGRHNVYFAAISVSHFPIAEAYLVDGSVTLSNGVVRKNFTVGGIESDISCPEWTKVFSIPDIRLQHKPSGEPFTIRVRYRLLKDFNCVSLSCSECFREKVKEFMEGIKPKLESQETKQEAPKPHIVQSLMSDLKKLLFSPDSSDVTFRIGDESVFAHQLILTARVPYFERLFASGTCFDDECWPDHQLP